MRAKTKLEKEAASKMFAALTEKQEGYVIKNFFHYAYRTGKDNCTCMRCGGTFRSDDKKAVCPNCGSRVDMIDTQKDITMKAVTLWLQKLKSRFKCFVTSLQ